MPIHRTKRVLLVGLGPVGLALADQLIDWEIPCLVLEAGKFHQDLISATEGTKTRHGSVSERAGGVGGSGQLWGGQLMRMHRQDFLLREHMPFSGWPLSYDELAEYYDRLEKIFNIALPSENAPPPNLIDFNPLRGTRSGIHTVMSAYTCDVTLNSLIERVTKSPLVEIRTDCLVTEVVVEKARVSGVKYQSENGPVFEAAELVVLSAGTLENTRLLLSSKSDHGGIGNENGLLGRYLADHPSGPIGTFESRGPKKFEEQVRTLPSGVMIRRKYRISDQAQRLEKLGNSVAELWPKSITECDPEKRSLPLKLRSLLKTPELSDRRTELCIILEQTNNPESKLIISPTGSPLPKLTVDWRMQEQDNIDGPKTIQKFCDFFNRLGFGKLKITGQDPLTDFEGWSRGHDAKHPSGTIRMGRSPKTGVVNAHGQLWDFNNLFVIGSATFPTASYCNPTLTAMALAVRSAREIKKVLIASM